VIICTAIFVATPGPAPSAPAPAPIAPVQIAGPDHPQVLRLTMPDGGFGSGVVIADDWVLTCMHCLPVETAGEFSAKHSIPHPYLDLGLVWVPGVKANGLQFGATAQLHDPVSAYGWHLAKHFMRTDGYQGDKPDGMSAPIIHGCSGGAVVNADGQLLGVIAWVVYARTGGGWDSYALPHIAGYTPIGEDERIWIAEQIELNDPK
jgi:hypothetical protein